MMCGSVEITQQPDGATDGITLAYGTANDCTNPSCNYVNGKLQTATRANHDATLGRVDVTETYAYRDGAGRGSDRSTAIGSTASFAGANFSDAQTWDDTSLK